MTRPSSFYNIGYADYDDEKSRVEVAITTLTAGNVVAQLTLAANLVTAIAAMVLGEKLSETAIFSRLITGTTPATNTAAQREQKWLVRYHDGTTQVKYQVSLPCADSSLLTNHQEFLDMAGTEAAAFKTAFEAIVRSPDDNNLCVVDSIQLVGRNS